MKRFVAVTTLLVLLLVSASDARLLKKAYFVELFKEKVCRALPWEEDAVELVKVVVEPPQVEVPDGAEERIRVVGRPKPGSNTLLVDYLIESTLVARVRVVGFVDVKIPVVVLKRPVARHAVLSREDLAVERRSVTRVPQDAITSPEEAVGLRTKFGLSAGQLLRRSVLEHPPLIRRNQPVRIVARTPYITVVAYGKAKEDGRLGEVIRVVNLASKREVYARVVSEDTVEVSF